MPFWRRSNTGSTGSTITNAEPDKSTILTCSTDEASRYQHCQWVSRDTWSSYESEFRPGDLIVFKRQTSPNGPVFYHHGVYLGSFSGLCPFIHTACSKEDSCCFIKGVEKENPKAAANIIVKVDDILGFAGQDSFARFSATKMRQTDVDTREASGVGANSESRVDINQLLEEALQMDCQPVAVWGELNCQDFAQLFLARCDLVPCDESVEPKTNGGEPQSPLELPRGFSRQVEWARNTAVTVGTVVLVVGGVALKVLLRR